MVVWNVTPSLHTPLMSVTNAISSIIAIGALVQVAPPLDAAGSANRPNALILGLASLLLVLTAVNMFAGFAVTRCRLRCSANDEEAPVRTSSFTVSYIGATILFILSLAASQPETARRVNLFGIIGTTVAVLATVLGPRSGQLCRHPRGSSPRSWSVAVGHLRRKEGADDADARAVVALMHSLRASLPALVGFAQLRRPPPPFPTTAEGDP